MKYLFLILLFTSLAYSEQKDNVFLYTEVYGPQESIIAPNLEIVLLERNDNSWGNKSLRLRGGARLSGLTLFSFYPSFIGGVHYIVGFEHKLDLGVNLLYQKFTEDYVFNTGTSLSFNIGYRHNISESWFIGVAINPTYSRENKPFYPMSFKIGFALF